MPILTSDFSPSIAFKNGHFNTIYRALFTKEQNNYQRKRITTWDADFIDLDFSVVGSKTIALLIHGLEGSSSSKYMLSIVKALNTQKIDAVAFNLRGCSGEDNLLLSTYHSGKTEDVSFVINHLLEHYNYENIVIVGYSLGGNLTLKYLGEFRQQLSPIIKGGVAVSVPVDLASSSKELSLLKNRVYINEFLKTLRIKVLEKALKFPEFNVDKEKLFKAKSFKDFDEIYTAPVFGFKNAEDYWAKASSKPFLSKINKPTLLINAKDDPFLAQQCYPIEEAKNSDFFHLEITKYGGHVGFVSSFIQKESHWLEDRILRFINNNILV